MERHVGSTVVVSALGGDSRESASSAFRDKGGHTARIETLGECVEYTRQARAHRWRALTRRIGQAHGVGFVQQIVAMPVRAQLEIERGVH
jgi:hypothetical protein